jgi:hypothetical protein
MFLLVSVLSAHAATTYHYQEKGDYFESEGSVQVDACTTDYAWIYASSAMYHSTGSPYSYSEAYLDLYSYNSCTGAWTGSFGVLSTAKVNKGTVTASGDIYDYWSGTTTSVTVSGSITASVSVKGNFNNMERWPVGNFRSHSNGSYSNGTGTLTVNGVVYTSDNAAFGTDNNGDIYFTEF